MCDQSLNDERRVVWPFSGAGLPRATPGGAMDIESDEHAARGRRIRRADFTRAALILQFANRFATPGAAPGGARPRNDGRRTVWDHITRKVQFR